MPPPDFLPADTIAATTYVAPSADAISAQLVPVPPQPSFYSQPTGRQWADTVFYAQCRSADAGVRYVKADTARGAMKLAYELYGHLPLSDIALCNDGLKQKLNIPDALFVAAEMIPRIPDHNRGGRNRIDFFAYMPSGEVFRFHPGHKAKDDAQVQRMTRESHLFDFADAAA